MCRTTNLECTLFNTHTLTMIYLFAVLFSNLKFQQLWIRQRRLIFKNKRGTTTEALNDKNVYTCTEHVHLVCWARVECTA